MRLTVIGVGYLGAVHAPCMADIGHEVLGVDINAEKIAALAEGRTPFFEPGLQEILTRALATGNLRFTTSLAQAAEFGEVHFICVGTPQLPGSDAADMRHVDSVIEGLAPQLRGECLVVGKSTVPVGTARRLTKRIAELAPAGTRVELAWNPEFLREGRAVEDTLHPDRLVVGVTSDRADAMLRSVYAPMLEAGRPYVVTDLATAELAKVSANSFLATKISFMNAMAEVCDATGGDVVTLAEVLGHDPRIGHHFLSAGLGFGGGCLPKDIRAFMARGEELGFGRTLSFLHEIDEINMRCRGRAVDMAREFLGGSLLGRRVAVLGVAFKPDSDDIRDSPALNVAAMIMLQGAHVRVHDPEAIENARAVVPGLDYAVEATKACEGAELVLHLTEWREYRELDPAGLACVVAAPRLIDARNVLDVDGWRTAGWTVRTLGRPVR